MIDVFQERDRFCEFLKENLPKITGLSCDSRKVKKGDMFFAIPGNKQDGRTFIAEAIGKGAFALVTSPLSTQDLSSIAFDRNFPWISLGNVRQALAQVAALFYDKQPQYVVGVTGTSGKTSVAEFARQIFASCDKKSASLGTLGVQGEESFSEGEKLTTPDPIHLHATLARLAEKNVTHLAMEVSSHALDQYRVDGVHFSAAVFTNISRDHLDYHLTLEAYFAAKKRFFLELLSIETPVIIQSDTSESFQIEDICRQKNLRAVSVGKNGQYLQLSEMREAENFASQIQLIYEGRVYPLVLPLLGEFQISNALLAAAAALIAGEKPERVFKALENLKSVPGRLEYIGQYRQAPIFVDYAHKPDALKNVLCAVRPRITKRLILVFGAGGNRDAGKRPLMGAIAAEYADIVIVTDDNPRSEDPASIRAAILASAPKALEIPDRAEAIHKAIRMLEPGDGLIIAGKGHEEGQIIGEQIRPFSDQRTVKEGLRLFLGLE